MQSLVYGFLKCFGLLIITTLAFHLISIMYGAPMFEKAIETFNLSLLISFLAVLPTFVAANKSWNNWLQIVFMLNCKEDLLLYQTVFTCFSTIVGAWLGAFPIPLDWDRPWQVWPVSCVYGAVLGHCLGVSVGTVRLLMLHKYKNKRK
ncbi:hypothetical protein HELRODRAFT_66403 [Helobdella robusta]|uniref:Phosphatidylinositol-glycan biosynthesis class F protein n=1 Tax=Helobdella robusta TaxID=6412 RepID=T1FYK6_HELRO|nr:hypothetical protein HELRODRAFT_66403 [Helobdella robusta]ESO01943.1 hypothetical protein HELRODRAFT_66403 [Helobdella robusta]